MRCSDAPNAYFRTPIISSFAPLSTSLSFQLKTCKRRLRKSSSEIQLLRGSNSRFLLWFLVFHGASHFLCYFFFFLLLRFCFVLCIYVSLSWDEVAVGMAMPARRTNNHIQIAIASSLLFIFCLFSRCYLAYTLWPTSQQLSGVWKINSENFHSWDRMIKLYWHFISFLTTTGTSYFDSFTHFFFTSKRKNFNSVQLELLF